MRTIERLIEFLFPTALINQTMWRAVWDQKERTTYLITARIFFVVAGAGYVTHYFLFDLALDLAPAARWLLFRSSMVVIALVCLGLTFTRLAGSSYYKWPVGIAGGIYSFFQAKVLIWYPEASWMWPFAFVVISALTLRSSPINGAVYANVLFACMWPVLIDAGIQRVDLMSAVITCTIFVLFIRSSYTAEVRNFILDQQNISAQKQIVELNIELADRIRAFIPRTIANRLTAYVEQQRMTALQAALKVLEPRIAEVSCLFSDIRGFTESSKDLDAFVHRSVIPDVKVCSDTVEDFGGIPRKIGDLVFAYFDEPSVHLNALRCVAAGLAVARATLDRNATTNSFTIRRYILISTGEAVIGNLGGVGSSVEITALGSPVNFLSRLDDATKSPQLSEILNPCDLVVCQRTYSVLMDLGVDIELQEVDLKELNISVRDFPEVDSVYVLRPSDHNVEAVSEPYGYAQEQELLKGQSEYAA